MPKSTGSTLFRRYRRTAYVLLGLVFLSVIFFRELVFGNLILARGDTFLYFYPYWHAAAQAIRDGSIPLWNPNLFMGAPFLANSQVGLLYPLNWPFWLLLETPYAVTASIVTHVILAAVGAFFAARHCLALSTIASAIVAILFALGGYLTSQVEHVNQLQGLAWLPWFFVAVCTWDVSRKEWRPALKMVVVLATLYALQFLAGHAQTTFITTIGLVIWIGFDVIGSSRSSTEHVSDRQTRPTRLLFQFVLTTIPVFGGLLLGAAIAGAQLVPTFELAQYSVRQGGLAVNEALSFSLHPLVIARSLMPSYGQPLFSEYVSALPVAALLLAVIGARFWRSQKPVLQAVALSLAGLFLALGLFNPIYHLLVRLPLFNLFRAPARWLVLYGFGMALLAGLGWDTIVNSEKRTLFSLSGRPQRPLVIGLLLLLGLMILSVLTPSLSTIVPLGAETTAERPNTLTISIWFLELLIAFFLIWAVIRAKRWRFIAVAGLAILLMLIVFLSSSDRSFNQPTTPEAFFDWRPPIARLVSMTGCDEDRCQPPDRFLSLSDIFFDVGDQAEIDTIYEDQISDQARYDYTVAIKQKEVIAPNLSLVYGLASIDGFDGGLLPLAEYGRLSSLFLDEPAVDGRLRENLRYIPDDRWMDLFNVAYLITDKTGDRWFNDVFFDMQFPLELSGNGDWIGVGYLPEYESTGVWLISDDQPGALVINTAKGETINIVPKPIGDRLWQAVWPKPEMIRSMRLLACNESLMTSVECDRHRRVDALSLIDQRDGSFFPLVFGQYRLIHSGDVKIYRNLDALTRASLFDNWRYVPDPETALTLMSDREFDPSSEAIIVGEGQNVLGDNGSAASDVKIVSYEPEEIVLETESEREALLLVTDAYYPGWKATVDGESVDLVQVDVLFRGLMVPAGKHVVFLSYRPASWIQGLGISLVGIIVLAILCLLAWRPSKRAWSPYSPLPNQS